MPRAPAFERLVSILDRCGCMETGLCAPPPCFQRHTFARWDILASRDGGSFFVLEKKGGVYRLYENDNLRDLFTNKIHHHQLRQWGHYSIPFNPPRGAYYIHDHSGERGDGMCRFVVYLASQSPPKREGVTSASPPPRQNTTI
jgi:hypothetical protein